MAKPKLGTLKPLKGSFFFIRGRQLKGHKWTMNKLFNKVRKQAINTWAVLIVSVIIIDSLTQNPII